MKKSAEVEIPDIKRRDITLPIACRNCVFYRKLAAYAKGCEELGVAPSAKTCTKFVPDPEQMDQTDRLLQTLTTVGRAKKPELVYAAMLSAAKVRRTGYRVGQTVFFRVLGGDYLSNYARGVVVGSVRDSVVVIGAELFTACLKVSSVLSSDDFLVKKERLVSAGKINDPGVTFERIRVRDRKKLLAHVPKLAGGTAKAKAKRGRPSKVKAGEFNPIVIGR